MNAICLVGDPAPLSSMVDESATSAPYCFSRAEVLGQSVSARMIERLRRHDARVTVIKSAGSCDLPQEWGAADVIKARTSRELEIALTGVIQKSARNNSTTTLVCKLGAYVEFDLENGIRFHESRKQAVTPIRAEDGGVYSWLVDARKWSGVERPMQFFTGRENHGQPLGDAFVARGYVNRLSNACDLRKLVMDAFLGRCSIKPVGREVKPGVWAHESARMHKSVRLVAPVYIGKNATVESGAVISRFTNIESGCHIGKGSIVSYASILPRTRVGMGLDISRAFVDGCEFTDLRRGVTLRLNDPNLLAEASSEKWHAPALQPRPERNKPRSWQPELEYSQYLTRAAGRLLEAFKGEA